MSMGDPNTFLCISIYPSLDSPFPFSLSADVFFSIRNDLSQLPLSRILRSIVRGRVWYRRRERGSEILINCICNMVSWLLFHRFSRSLNLTKVKLVAPIEVRAHGNEDDP